MENVSKPTYSRKKTIFIGFGLLIFWLYGESAIDGFIDGLNGTHRATLSTTE